ncbi:MAG TPA: hypothetical protein VG125_19925 [Pirellulales bacterium]|jgi:hypothetical protein|nr:hypothetical protein [Pirellulales bacterium]
MRLGFLTLIAMMIPAVLAAVEPESSLKKGPPARPLADSAVLEKKLAELKALQAEIRQLRGSANNQQLLISVQMLEVSPKPSADADALDLGVTPGLIGGGDEATESPHRKRQRVEAGVVLDRRQLAERLAQWREKGVVSVVAEPKLVTVSGRPAQFHVGGLLAIPDKAKKHAYQEYGTHVDVVAMADDDGTIRLELRARQSSLDSQHAITVEGQTVPGLLVQEIDTAAKLLPGQVLVAGVFTGNRPDVERSPEAASPDKAVEPKSKVGFIVLAEVEPIDGMLPIESDKPLSAKDSGHAQGARR